MTQGHKVVFTLKTPLSRTWGIKLNSVVKRCCSSAGEIFGSQMLCSWMLETSCISLSTTSIYMDRCSASCPSQRTVFNVFSVPILTKVKWFYPFVKTKWNLHSDQNPYEVAAWLSGFPHQFNWNPSIYSPVWHRKWEHVTCAHALTGSSLLVMFWGDGCQRWEFRQFTAKANDTQLHCVIGKRKFSRVSLALT